MNFSERRSGDLRPWPDCFANTYELAVANVPCGIGGQVSEANELDMFLEPIQLNTAQATNLGEMGQLVVQAVTNVSYYGSTDNCNTNLAGYVIGLVLSSISTPNQLLYIQIDVGGSSPGPNGLAWCPDYENTTKPEYLNRFCVDDSVSSYGGSYFQGYGYANNSLDVLPRIIQIITQGHVKSGPYKIYLDNNPSQWRMSGVYFGVVAYGGKITTTQWNNLELREAGGSFCSGTQKTQYICEPPKNPALGWVDVGGGCYHRPSAVSC